MPGTIGGTVSVGVSLAANYNPVTITGIINPDTGSYALYGPSGIPWAVTNAGVIAIGAASPNVIAVTLANGYLLNAGTIIATNTAGGFGNAVQIGGGTGSPAAGTVVNKGVIIGNVPGVIVPAVLLESGGTFTDAFYSSVTAATSGVAVRNIAQNGQGEAIFNSGTITGANASSGYGVALSSGMVSNGFNAVISNWHYGVDLSGPGTITNASSISSQIGVLMSQDGYLFNAPFASITGTDGPAVEAFSNSTIVNGGIISAGAPGQDAIKLNGGLLIIDANATFNGVVDGGGGTMQVTGSQIITGVGTTFVAFNEIDFLPGAFAEVTGSAAGFNGMTIAGFFTGSVIELTGASDTVAGFNDGTLSLAGSDPISLVMGTGFAGSDYSAVQVNGNTDISVACFAAGTRILTDAGEVSVEELRPGMRAVSFMHTRALPIIWVGSQCSRIAPVRIATGALGAGMPHRALHLSPDHAVLVDGALIPVRYLVNDSSIAPAPHRALQQEAMTYFHVELAGHAVLLAEGLPAESYLDTGNRTVFDRTGTSSDWSTSAPLR